MTEKKEDFPSFFKKKRRRSRIRASSAACFRLSELLDVDVPEAPAKQRQQTTAVHPPLGDSDHPSLSAPRRWLHGCRCQRFHRVGDQHLGRDQLMPPCRRLRRAVAVRHRAHARRRVLAIHVRRAGGPNDAAEEAWPNHATAAAAALPRGHQRAVRRAEPAPAARELLADASEVAALPAAVGLAVLGAPLCALAAPIHPAPLATAVLHATVRAPARALAALRHRASLPAAVRHAEVRAAVDALGAHAAALVHAPLPAAVRLAQRRAAFGPLAAPLEDAPLPAAVRLAVQGAALGSFAAVRELAPPPAAVGDAQPHPPLGAPDATLDRAPLPAAVLDAPPGLAPRGFRAVKVAAPSAAAMGDAVIRLPFGALGAAELQAPASPAVGLAVGRAALGALVAPGLLAPLPATVSDAQARRASRALGAPFEPALLGMPALSLLSRIACHRHNIRARATKGSFRHGCRRFRAEPKTAGISAAIITVVRVI
jgi:hypothetical protein